MKPSAAGSDVIDATEAAGASLIYGDTMNTALLLAQLEAILEEQGISGDTGLTNVSGTDVFAWLEENSESLGLDLSSITGHEGAWTVNDTNNYILTYASQMGYELRMSYTAPAEEGEDAKYTYYLVDENGDIFNISVEENGEVSIGSAATGVTLDELVGRDGGHDKIYGSEWSDTIYGQEGNDATAGGLGNDSIYGGTGNDVLMGDGNEKTLVSLNNALALGANDILTDQMFASAWSLSSVELQNLEKQFAGDENDGSDKIFAGTGNDLLFGMGGDDYLVGGAGQDMLFGGEGQDLLMGDGSASHIHAIKDGLGFASDYSPTVSEFYAAMKDSLAEKGNLDTVVSLAESSDSDDDDILLGGSGDDLLFGMGGNDYLVGGEGADFLFGGAGNDLIVYDVNDLYIGGGSGMDFLLAENSELGLEDLTNVHDVEVLITGSDALSLTSMSQLAEDYGITVSEDGSTLQLSKDSWDARGDGVYEYTGDAELILTTSLNSVDESGLAGDVAEASYILSNAQG